MWKFATQKLQGRLVKALVPALLLALMTAPTMHAASLRPSASPAQRQLVLEVKLAASITESNTTVGMADSNLYGESQADVDKSLDEMKAMGVNDVRILIPWAYVEPLPGVYNWSQLDMIVNAANARGMGVLGVLNSTPPWATAPGEPVFSGAPADVSQYANFAGAVASRYTGQISAYEVWNEQNSAGFYSGPNGGPDAAGYTQLLKAAYPAIKAADPNAEVIAGGLISVYTYGNQTVDPVTFVQQMYADGAKGYFDALAFHPYQYTMKFSQGTPYSIAPINQVAAIHQLMVANGDGAKTIWTTEYGEPSYPNGDANQADFISDYLNTWKTLPYGGPSFIYTTVDTNSSSTNPDDTLGIFRDDWTAKPAVQVIADFIAANQPPAPAASPQTMSAAAVTADPPTTGSSTAGQASTTAVTADPAATLAAPAQPATAPTPSTMTSLAAPSTTPSSLTGTSTTTATTSTSGTGAGTGQKKHLNGQTASKPSVGSAASGTKTKAGTKR